MEEAQQLSGKLSNADLKKCGIGTENACFALTAGSEGMECSGVGAQQGDENKAAIFYTAGKRLKWRVNVDETDQKAWCPKGVLNNSKP